MRHMKQALVLLLALLAARPWPARAQTCQLVQQPASRLYGVDSSQCGTAAKPCAAAVRITVDRLSGLPIILWYSDDKKVRYSRFDGSKWSAAAVVPLGGLTVPEHKAISTTFNAVSLATDSSGRLHVVLSDGKQVYHLQRGAGAWTKPQAIATIPHSNLTGLETFAATDGQDRLHVTYWYEAGVGFVRHAVRASGSWSSWADVGGGDARHIDVALEQSGALHVSWIRRMANSGGLRNWQAFYRRRAPGGAWGAIEQVTSEKPVATTIGPLAIKPSVAVDPAGVAHVVYPVDPPDSGGDDDGHASHTQRSATGKWSKPVKLFTNARHSALLQLVVDSRGARYAFGLNRQRRLSLRPPGGAWKQGTWHSSKGGLWFFFDSVATAGGAWLAYVPARRWGPVEVLYIRRKGSCGCVGYGVCSPGQSQSKSCGVCGTSNRSCASTCQWSKWGPCDKCPGKDASAGPDQAAPAGDGVSKVRDGQASHRGRDVRSAGPAISGEGCGCEVAGQRGGSGLWLVLLLLLRRRAGRRHQLKKARPAPRGRGRPGCRCARC